MTEKSKKLKKGLISELDISTLLQRYTANTVLALLQEVAQLEGGVKIDWNALVQKSSTGISSPREYQMLWRHLAYRHSLLDTFDNAAPPLDDDSDLEYELEAFPDVSAEASAEASACVKVLIASGLKSDSSHPNNAMVEAPLTINIPSGQLVKATSESSQLPAMRGMNITVPVSVQKQPVPAMASAEALDANGSVNGTIPPRRKKKIWTEAEDLELVAAVQKYGEGNWANILRSESTWDRTASQLSQRWGVIRRKVGIGNLNLATTTTTNTGGVQLSEAQRAARIAMNLALDPPVKNTFIKSGEGTSSQRCFATKPSSKMQLSSVGKSQVTVSKPVKPDLSSDPVRAAAVAAGARIATQSDAASLLRAAQAKNAIHIMPTVGSSIKSALPSSASSHTEAHSNVSFNLPTASVSTHPAVSPSGLRPALEKASSQSTSQHNPISGTAMNVSTARASSELPSKQGLRPALEKTCSQSTSQHNPISGTSMNLSTTQANSELPLKQGLGPALARASSQSTQHNPMSVSSKQANTEIPLKQDVVYTRAIKTGANVAKVLVQDNGASVAGKEPSKQVKPETKPKTQESAGERLKVSQKMEVPEGSDGKDKMDCISASNDENQCAVEGQVTGVARSVADKKL
ncbi:Homeodomain-like superfamily protein [Euphorbia peplus]|nr:Homeodomain-like superfamily protein [Euphorbia peplus]